MSKSELEEIIRNKFLDELMLKGTVVDDMKSLAYRFDDTKIRSIFESWSKNQREIYLVKNVGFINLHIRCESFGFWGVRKNVIRDFVIFKKELGAKCFFVLLIRDEKNGSVGGYILEDMNSTPILKKPSEQKEDFKINENILDTKEKFHNLSELIKALLAKNRKLTGTTVIRRSKTK